MPPMQYGGRSISGPMLPPFAVACIRAKSRACLRASAYVCALTNVPQVLDLSMKDVCD